MDSAYTNDDGESVGIDVSSEAKNPAEETMHLEKVEVMREIVKKLKPRYRDLIEKRYFQELSYEEIADDMAEDPIEALGDFVETPRQDNKNKL